MSGTGGVDGSVSGAGSAEASNMESQGAGPVRADVQVGRVNVAGPGSVIGVQAGRIDGEIVRVDSVDLSQFLSAPRVRPERVRPPRPTEGGEPETGTGVGTGPRVVNVVEEGSRVGLRVDAIYGDVDFRFFGGGGR